MPVHVTRRQRAFASISGVVALIVIVAGAVPAAALDPTSTTVSCGATAAVGVAQTCTATVLDATGVPIPGATATFAADGAGTFAAPVCDAPSGTCRAAYTPSAFGSGSQSVTAAFAGDGTHAASAGTGTLTVAPDNVYVLATCSAADHLGQPRSCTFRVVDNTTATTTPTGTVSLAQGNAGWSFPGGSSCALVSGACTLTVVPSTGVQPVQYVNRNSYSGALTMAFTGGAGFTQIASGRLGYVQILADTTSTSVSCGATGPTGSTQTCTATVADLYQTFPNTAVGYVAFSAAGAGAVSPGGCQLSNGACSVSYTTSGVPDAARTVTATFQGTAAFLTSSATAAVAVAADPTATTLACGPSGPVNRAQTCVVGVVDPLSTDAVPTGTVAVSSTGSGTLSQPTCTLVGGSCVVAFQPTGHDDTAPTVTASYTGTAAYAGSSATTSLTVVYDSTSTAVTCGATATADTARTCTVTTADTTSPATTVTGVVQVAVDNGVPGALSAPLCLLAGGTCSVTFTPSGPGMGSATVTASYPGAAAFRPSSATTTVQVTADTTSTTVGCDAFAGWGASTSCRVTVADTTSASRQPVGSVALSAPGVTFGGDPGVGTCTLSGGSCSFAYYPLDPSALGGSVTITAVFTSTSAYTSSSATTTPALAPASTFVEVSCGPSGPIGTAQTCGVSVTPLETGGVPGGTVQLSSDGQGSFDSSTCTLNGGSCSVAYTPAGPADSSQTITASYQGTAAFAAGSNTTGLWTGSDVTATAVTCQLGSAATGSPQTCSVTVSDVSQPSSTPSGAVQFTSDGNGTFDGDGTCALSAGTCQIGYTPTSGDGSGQTVTASYGGTTGVGSSAASTTLLHAAVSTTTAVVCGPSAAAGVGQSCTVTVTDAAGEQLTGTAHLAGDGAGATSAPSCSLTAGSCAISYTPSAFGDGTQTVTASYDGDPQHEASTGTTLLTIAADATSTAVTCAAGATTSTARACTVTVTDATSPATVPTGSVALSTDGAGRFDQTSCSLAAGSCTVGFTPVHAGAQTLSVTFTPGQGFAPSGGTAALTVAPDTTSTAVVCGAPAGVGTAQTCTVTVTDAGSPTTLPTGSAILSSSGAGTFGNGGTCTLAGGSCTVTYTPSAAGTGSQQVTGRYLPDPDFAASSSQTQLTVVADATGTSVSCPHPNLVGRVQWCTVTVVDTVVPAKVPSGSVQFVSDGAATFSGSGRCALRAGSCSVSVTPTAFGTGLQTITAGYAGDTSHLASGATATLGIRSDTTKLVLTCGPAAASGVAQACLVTVTDTSSPSLVPTGVVALTTGTGTTLSAASCSLSGGSCGVSVTPGPVNTAPPTVTARYGAGNGWSASSARTTVAVVPDVTSLTVVCGRAAPVGRAQRCAVRVTDGVSGVAPTGTVRISADGAGQWSASTCKLSSGGCSVTYTPTAFGSGSQTVTASYDGNAGHLASSATTALTMTVDTTAAVVACGPSATTGTPQTCTVVVTDTATPSSVPGGTAQFSVVGAGAFVGGTASCTLTAGTCAVTWTPATSKSGGQPVTVVVTGATGFGNSTARTTVVVVPGRP